MIAANDNDARCCPRCGSQVVGRNDKIYCSKACKYASKKRTPKDYTKRLEHITYTCQHCGEDYHPKRANRSQYCSKSCQGKARIAVINASKNPVPPKPVRYVVRRPMCERCGARFTAVSVASRLCSDECRRVESLDKMRERSAANVNKKPRDCAECGLSFTPSYGDKRSVYCSDRCFKRSSHRVARHARRALLKLVTVERVNPTNVFDRDNWTCRQCGVSTPRDLRGTYEPNAPELDHVIPLSKGGEHSYANTQCLCRQCNGAKSNTLPMAA